MNTRISFRETYSLVKDEVSNFRETEYGTRCEREARELAEEARIEENIGVPVETTFGDGNVVVVEQTEKKKKVEELVSYYRH